MNIPLTLFRIFCIWIFVWPSATLILWILRQFDVAWPLAVQTCIMTLIIVPLISLIIGPWIQRLFTKFLSQTQ